MKKTLEKKILKKIYHYETKKTFADVFFQMLVIVLIGLLVLFFGWLILDSLEKQQTLDFISLVSQEFSIMKYYWLEVMGVFFSELPFDLTVLLVGCVVVFLFICFVVLKNAKKVRRRIQSIGKYWSRRA